MARADKSVFQIMDENTKPATEIAATVLQQKMMEQAGELQSVHFVGPNGKMINGFYSPIERAFLPKFKVE